MQFEPQFVFSGISSEFAVGDILAAASCFYYFAVLNGTGGLVYVWECKRMCRFQ